MNIKVLSTTSDKLSKVADLVALTGLLELLSLIIVKSSFLGTGFLG